MVEFIAGLACWSVLSTIGVMALATFYSAEGMEIPDNAAIFVAMAAPVATPVILTVLYWDERIEGDEDEEIKQLEEQIERERRLLELEKEREELFDQQLEAEQQRFS